ncbi:MAG: transglycosylase domain-containing protein [Candidatus Taylorbacteria bacterium]|nr:transglycosylase domain-containing protein [Candidatus Taylorbacteria bacterium]
MKRSPIILCLGIIITLICINLIYGAFSVHRFAGFYDENQSVKIVDRNDRMVVLIPNSKGNYALYATSTPERFSELLLKKEDRFFYMHPGINPFSIGELILAKAGIGDRQGASTIEQQLIKLLLGQENERTFANKSVELMSVLPLDLFMGKKKVLLKYCNSVYFGNHIQGVETASQAYFAKPAQKLSDNEILQLLSSLGNPSYNNPLLGNNIGQAIQLGSAMDITATKDGFVSPETAAKNLKNFLDQKDGFELNSYISITSVMTTKTIKVSTDRQLTEKIRTIVMDSEPSLASRDAHNIAVVVMKLPSNEILSLIGSANPAATTFGQQINMLNKPRQVASTIKPFVYAKAFEKGARPDSLIDDVEYRYTTFDGRTLYPKNYDMKYHGRVTAAYALANSINIPAIKTLQFVGLDAFANFLGELGYTDIKKVHDHQLGAALGTIDMTLPELVHFYSIFPNEGMLKPMRLFSDEKMNKLSFPGDEKQVIEPQYTELVTKILSDRYAGIDQFGYVSDLNLPFGSYALKTGTSDDYRDSWVIGYTPDYIVGVWVGNSDNTPTKSLSGQSGAGEVWSRVMQLMHATSYDRHTPFSFKNINREEESATARTLLLDNK